MTVIIGIDPGFSGAIAKLSSKGMLEIWDMPIVADRKGRSVLNLYELYELFSPKAKEDYVAVLEQVASRPGQSAPATFRFGQGYGVLEMGLAAHKIEKKTVTPAKWKKYFGLSKDKGASRGLAIERFPQYASLFKRVKDDGRAEAALLALYGKEVLYDRR